MLDYPNFYEMMDELNLDYVSYSDKELQDNIMLYYDIMEQEFPYLFS